MATDTSKITTAANDLGDGLAKGGAAAKTLGQEIVNAIKSLDSRVSALEAGGGSNPIPPDPIPPDTGGPTGGLITNFTNQANKDFLIDNKPVGVHGAGAPWGLKQLDDTTLRYEVRPGDKAWYDGGTVERSMTSMYVKKNDNEVVKVAYRLMVEAGPVQNAQWMTLGEMHNDDSQLSYATSPYVAVELQGGDRFAMVYRYSAPGSSNIKTATPWKQAANFERGRWYIFELEFKGNQTAGYLKLKLDGEQVVDYKGPLGYGCRGYWMHGPYREAGSNQTFAAQVKNQTGNW